MGYTGEARPSTHKIFSAIHVGLEERDARFLSDGPRDGSGGQGDKRLLALLCSSPLSISRRLFPSQIYILTIKAKRNYLWGLK